MSYADALAFTRKAEGGWYPGDQPWDPNPTMYGVTQHTYDGYRDGLTVPRRSVQLIADDELAAIYRSYWDDAQCELLPSKTGTVVFDHAINAGPESAIEALQLALGVTADGQIGPKTKAALAASPDDVRLARNVLWARLESYRRIVHANPKKRPVLIVWLDRVIDQKAVLGV